ncbi:MAG: hypothetical protein QOJ64_745 [Acidobacteriota bacterium]|jgi:hypothetical protein|nr:hypothetical protein [Acidobacteriota bacterium]
MQYVHKRRALVAASLLAFLLVQVAAQQAPAQRGYIETASTTRRDGVVTVRANDPRPLSQALCAVIKQYNWLVDYEDPPYASDSELTDATDPAWRASHPGGRAFRVPAGGAFEFNYREDPAIDSAAGEEASLKALVAAYNSSGNPGKFVVRAEGDDSRPWSKSRRRFAVIGGDSSILDTPVTIPLAERSVDETLRIVLRELYAQSGTKVNPPGWANNALIQSRVSVGGTEVPARTLLLQTLRGISNPSLTWRLFYDADSHSYVLNLGVVRSFCN